MLLLRLLQLLVLSYCLVNLMKCNFVYKWRRAAATGSTTRPCPSVCASVKSASVGQRVRASHRSGYVVAAAAVRGGGSGGGGGGGQPESPASPRRSSSVGRVALALCVCVWPTGARGAARRGRAGRSCSVHSVRGLHTTTANHHHQQLSAAAAAGSGGAHTSLSHTGRPACAVHSLHLL
jgi:hypothetical protein